MGVTVCSRRLRDGSKPADGVMSLVDFFDVECGAGRIDGRRRGIGAGPVDGIR